MRSPHARLAFTLASAFAGTPIGPGPLDLPAAVPIHRSLAELAIATAGFAAQGFAHPHGLERFGLLTSAQAEACREVAIRLLIAPCREALLSRGPQRRVEA